MKKLLTLTAVAATLLACDGTTQEEKHLNEANDVLEEMESEFEKSMNELQAEMEANLDSAMSSLRIDFEPSSMVDRYTNEEPLEFKDQNWDGSFYFLFPVEPEFNETEKDDHTTFTASEIVSGTIYEVSIEDYQELGEEVIDEGFTEFIHKGLVDHMGGDVFEYQYLNTDDGSFGFYSCYTYDLGEHSYMVDHVTYGFYDKMVHLIVTSRPKCESSTRVTEFIEGFEIVP